MASLNKILLIGNLTRDPELRYTPSGVAVTNLRLAVNRRYRDKTGELKEETCFITATVWNKQAEACNQYLQKGRPVFVEGRLQSRSWENNEGQKRSVVEVRAERVQFLGVKGSQQRIPPASEEPATGAGEGSSSEGITWEENIDERS